VPDNDTVGLVTAPDQRRIAVDMTNRLLASRCAPRPPDVERSVAVVPGRLLRDPAARASHERFGDRALAPGPASGDEEVSGRARGLALHSC
jgi:hypothetical protein